MIFKDLIFTYDININELYNKTLEDNKEIITEIPEIVRYEQGIWNDKRRKDKIRLKMLNIPPDLIPILQNLFLNKNNEIDVKIKIKKTITKEEEIKLKIKIKLINIISNMLFKLINFKIFINIKTNGDKGSIVNVRYEINSLLGDNINTYIENKINFYFINKINNFLINRNNE